MGRRVCVGGGVKCWCVKGIDFRCVERSVAPSVGL